MSNLASDRGLFSTNAKGEKDWLEAYHQFLYSCDDACTESQSPKGHPFIIQVLMSFMLDGRSYSQLEISSELASLKIIFLGPLSGEHPALQLHSWNP